MSFSNKTYRQDKSLFISAGHSDSDPGAVANGYTEADLVLVLRNKLVDFLAEEGVAVNSDGEDNENLPLREACKMAKVHDFSIELHFNAAAYASATGTEVLYDADESIASCISEVVSSTLGISDRGAKPESSGQHSRLAFIQAGGLILEVGFITNPDDLEAFFDAEDDMVKALGRLLADVVTEGGR